MPILACTTTTSPEQRQRLAALCGPEWEIRDYRGRRDALQREGAGVAIVYGTLDEPTFAALSDLEWIQQNFAGVEGLLFPALVESPVVVTNVRGAYATLMAEHVLAGLLYFARDLPRHRARRDWGRERADIDPIQLAGSAICVLGAGSIGSALCPRLAALGLNVLAVKRRVEAVPGATWVTDLTGMHAYLARCTHVVVLLPQTAATQGVVDADFLSALAPGGILVNVSRGGPVDTAALLAALDAGRLRGALLDSTSPEPPPTDSPLWDHPRVLLTGHRSCIGAEPEFPPFDLFLDNLALWLDGHQQEMSCVVDKARGY
ncbi:MAG: D-2-hydroxyacid dehydrogenase [Planctomycetota bacterium]